MNAPPPPPPRAPLPTSELLRRGTSAPYAAFAAFGLFWGAWGAALPTLRTQSGIAEGQLGISLLFIGVGALPAMALAGHLVDRVGLRLAPWLLVALAGAGLLVTTARGATQLAIGMLVVGAASGAADVAINALAGRAENLTSQPLVTRSHGLFSIGVVIASLSAGALLGSGLPSTTTFAVIAAAILVLAAKARLAARSLSTVLDHDDARGGTPRSNARRGASTRAPVSTLRRVGAAAPMVIVGLVAGLAYAIENAHQSWGAVMLVDVFTTSPGLAATAPAVFAATTAVARLALAQLSRDHPTAVLVGGGTLATTGTAILAMAPSVSVALVGLAIAALGTATLFPTLLSRSLRGTVPSRHGRATSTIAGTAYLGFLLGPAYVGLLAESSDLRGAFIGVAALGLAFTLAAAPLSTWASRRSRTV